MIQVAKSERGNGCFVKTNISLKKRNAELDLKHHLEKIEIQNYIIYIS